MKKLPKKKTSAQLKKELDKVFSEYNRKKYANQNGEVSCYTCGKTKHWKEMHNGHFVSRGYLATRFDENNCRVQCPGCNLFGGGRTAVFATKLDQELGEGTAIRLYRDAQKIVKDYPYQKQIEFYTQKINENNQTPTTIT